MLYPIELRARCFFEDTSYDPIIDNRDALLSQNFDSIRECRLYVPFLDGQTRERIPRDANHVIAAIITIMGIGFWLFRRTYQHG